MDIENNASLDPTQNFPAEVIEMIFNHFRGKELLKRSTVSWFWNNYIGKSKKCMAKLELRIGSDTYNKFNEAAKKSLVISRSHQNIRISEATKLYNYILDILSSKKDWKSLTIIDTEFVSTSSFMKFLKTIEETVETLKLYRVTIKQHEETNIYFEFKKLKSLTISGCTDVIFVDVFYKCPALNILEIYNPPTTIKTPLNIVNMLKCHEGVKTFKTDGKWFNFIFALNVNDQVSELPFKLIELSISGCGILIKTIDDIFLNFLKAQQFLETLYLGDCLGCDIKVLKAALELRALKTLNLFFLPIDIPFDIINLPKNESIEHLDILTINIDNKDKMKFILKSVPNVKNLRLRTMDEETARFMAANLKSLQKILSVYIKGEKLVREILANVNII
jgi:hypothetical protein